MRMSRWHLFQQLTHHQGSSWWDWSQSLYHQMGHTDTADHYWSYDPDALSLSQVTATHLKIGTRRWNLQVPDLQLSCRDLTTWQEYQDNITRAMPADWHAPFTEYIITIKNGVSSIICCVSSLQDPWRLFGWERQLLHPRSVLLQLHDQLGIHRRRTAIHRGRMYPCGKIWKKLDNDYTHIY